MEQTLVSDDQDRRKARMNIAIAVLLGAVALGVALLTIYRVSQGDLGR